MDIFYYKAKLNYKIKKTGTISLQLNYGRAVNESHFLPERPSSFNRSYETVEWYAPIKVNKIRKSIAVYYLVNPKKNEFNIRKKALYAPTKNQINKKNILKFIKLRSNAKSFSKVYK